MRMWSLRGRTVEGALRLLGLGAALALLALAAGTGGQVGFGQDVPLVCTLEGHANAVSSVAFSPDGKLLASGSYEEIKLWDVATGQCIRTLKGHILMVYSVSFSPDGRLLASGAWDKTVKLWDVATGECIRTLKGHTGGVCSVAFSPDGKLLASGSADDTIKLWDVATGQCIRTLKGHKYDVNSVAFSPDGKLLASASCAYPYQEGPECFQGQIKLWDIRTGKCLQTLKRHTRKVYSVAFSPDGKLLASGSRDQTIKLWVVSTGKVWTLKGHT